MVTSTAIASTLSRVRTGRWVRLAKISLFNTSLKSIASRAFVRHPDETPVSSITRTPAALRMNHAYRRLPRRTDLLLERGPRRLSDHHPAAPPCGPLPHHQVLLHCDLRSE